MCLKSRPDLRERCLALGMSAGRRQNDQPDGKKNEQARESGGAQGPLIVAEHFDDLPAGRAIRFGGQPPPPPQRYQRDTIIKKGRPMGGPLSVVTSRGYSPAVTGPSISFS